MSRRGFVLAICASACAPPRPSTPAAGPALPAAFAGSPGGPSIAAVDWRTFFAEPDLVALIGQAVDGNLDLRIALQRIERARAGVLGASGALLPSVAVVGGARIDRFGRYTPTGAGNATTDITPGRRVPENVPDLAFGLEASWEIDLWGQLRAARGAAGARYMESIEGTRLVVTELVADVASAYFDLAALDRRLATLSTTIDRQRQALEVMKTEKQVGRANELAVQQFAAQLAGTEAMRAATSQQIRATESTLALLAGRPLDEVRRTPLALDREVPAAFPTGVPADLLHNRADVRAAELEVAAARLDVTSARAAFYPRLAISAAVGYDAFDPRYLVSTPASLVYSAAANLVAPLINRRAIRARYAGAQAMQLEAIYGYQRAVLRAFLEVRTGVGACAATAEVASRARAKVEALSGSVDAATALFKAGKATYLEVLLAEQAQLDAELGLIGAIRDQQVARIRLYRALGGGWRGEVAATAGAAR